MTEQGDDDRAGGYDRARRAMTEQAGGRALSVTVRNKLNATGVENGNLLTKLQDSRIRD